MLRSSPQFRGERLLGNELFTGFNYRYKVYPLMRRCSTLLCVEKSQKCRFCCLPSYAWKKVEIHRVTHWQKALCGLAWWSARQVHRCV
jgi:hypothetical protein